ncbi:hypothetical protein Clacol_007559 [Clathrus columnatus]|uniref:Nucleoprotein TPR n=1 Tax=Clathrus columnatus TaxID=1419009 RepID=A0AAV5AF95_9AGAM|nr:hypothetical protein Clacol_007559 [Clathrus columnatus]
MKTRRRSTRKTGSKGEQDDSSQAAHSPSPSQVGPISLLNIQLPDDISLDSLSSLVPEVSFDAPTSEGLIRVYRIILAQASDLANATSDLEEARAQLLRKDIELDQAVQDKETAVSELEQSTEVARNELATVIQQRDEVVASQAALQSQMATLNVAQFSRSSDLDILQRRVDDSEREKRDLIAVVDRLRTDGTQAEEQIQVLKDNLKNSRAEISQLQTEIREVRSTETTNKFKIQSLEQQLEIAKQESERNAKELDTKIEEFSKYRRDTHTQHASLQSSLDSLRIEHESCKSELESLKRAHEYERQQHLASIEKINSLQDQLAEERAASRLQSETQTRLIELLEKRTAEAKKRVEEVDNEWDRTIQQHQDKEERLKELLRKEKERADRLETNISQLVEGSSSISAPEPSPGASVVASFMKGTKLSDLFDENRRTKEELQKVKTENLRLTETTSALISRMHEMAPQIAEQRVDYERQKQEIIHLSQQLSTIISERDANLHLAREAENNFQLSQKENRLLERQLADLGLQVQVLFRELGVLQNPSLSTVDQEDGPPESDDGGIDALITNQLVVFKHLPAFQEQYTKHLKVIRELGDKLERATKDQYDEQSRLETQALEEAEVAIAALQEELENQRRLYDIQIRGFMQERDMYKARMANSPQRLPVTDNRAAAPADTEYEALLADLQKNFDIYRTETGTDMQKLREELQESQRETARFETELAKATAKVDNYNARYDMLNEAFNQRREELTNLRRRNEELLNHISRIESASHQVSEQLATTNSVVERLRHETATLKAEKELWKGIERRLTEENQSLSKEKAQLSDVMLNINRIHSELEHSVHNDKRRLESHIQLLEVQRRVDFEVQLNKERETLRHVTMQKDIDSKEMQDKIDRLNQDLSKTREFLVAAETSQTHLQQRADDLSKQVQAGSEKLAVYERRSTILSGQAGQVVDTRSREEQLENEVAELRGSIKLMEMDLESSRTQIEQISNISRASETALEKVNEAYEEYRKSADANLADKESLLESLRDQLRAKDSELATSNARFNELNQQLESERVTFLHDKKTLEETIVDMSSNAAHVETDEAERVNFIRSIEERAAASEERYQRELIGHAEAVKHNEQLKEQLLNLKTKVRECENATETARSMLSTAEASWKTQRSSLDKEIADLTSRSQDLQKQNSILHQHLESVNSQASRIRQVAEQSTTNENQSVDDGSDLRPVVAYLRREKEIVDLQLELHKQENMRLKAQIEHLNRSLDETRVSLTEERERGANSVVSATQHAELLERINQLNLLRESNATLRSECESYRKQVESLETKLRHLSTELSPIKEEVTTLKAELSSKNAQVQRLEAENQQWKERNNQILSKYDRVDPAELQQLKDKVSTLEAEKASWDETKTTMEAELAQTERFKANLQSYKTQYADLVTRMRTLMTEHKEVAANRDTLKSQLEAQTQAFESERSTLKVQLDALVAEKSVLEKSLAEEKTRPQVATGETILPPTDQNQEAVVKAAVDSARIAWEEERTQITKAKDEAAEREKAASTQLQSLISQKTQLEGLNTKLRQRLAEELKKQREQQATQEKLMSAKVAEATAQQAREHEAAMQNAIADATAKAKAESQISASPNADALASAQPQPDVEAIITQHKQELANLEAQLTQKHESEMVLLKESVSQTAITGSGNALADVENVVKERMEAFQKEHEQKLTDAIERGRREVNMKLKLKDGQLAKALSGRKELEEQVKVLKEQLTAAGIIPSTSVPPTTTTVPPTNEPVLPVPSTPVSKPGASSTATPTIAPSSSTVPPAPPATPVAPASSAPSTLPPKPSATVVPVTRPGTVGQTTAVRGAAVRGRGRGVSIRGGAAAASQAAGRGGGVLAQVNSAAAASPSGTSILGAAAKRPREETEVAPPDVQSLAKRLRGTPPVTLQRNRHLPPTDPPP